MDLPGLLQLGEGELKSGGFNRDSILSDSVEAIIGAIYLDHGMDAVKGFVRRFFDEILAGMTVDTIYKDPKSRLQEFLQQRGEPVPDYEIVSVSGEPHDQTFEVACAVSVAAEPFRGSGPSRRTAEQRAARRALDALSRNG